MGSADPISFSRGKRGIAGSIIFTVLDRDPFRTMLTATNSLNNYYFAKASDLRNPADIYRASAELTDTNNMPLGVRLQPPLYADQVLPWIW